MKRLLLFISLFAHTIYSLGQTISTDFGGRSKGVGNSNSTLSDEWSLFNNVGGISGVEDGTCFFSYDHYASELGFDHIGAGVLQPMTFSISHG